MIHNIEKTLPIKIGKITSVLGVPFNEEAKSFENRLKRTIQRIFHMKTISKEYWNVFKNMISNSNETFGLVAIDGYVTDVMGKDDIALIFNMGTPRLRARKIHHLERVYAYITKTNDIKFYNSLLDDKEHSYFDFNFKSPAWHPHINGTEPCLGGYQNDLIKWKREANPIMYLKLLHSFLNTWNTRSPFWNLNHTKMTNYSTLEDSKEWKEKEYSTSIFYCINYLKGWSRNNNHSNESFRQFINDNINKINTSSITNDVYLLANIYQKINNAKQYLLDDLSAYIDNDDYSYIRSHYLDKDSRKENRRNISKTEFSILPIQTDRNTLVCIPVATNDGKRTSLSYKGIMAYDDEIETEEYSLNQMMLSALSRVLENIYIWVSGDAILKKLINDTDYAIRIYCQYVAPLETKSMNHYDMMTLSGLYDHRIKFDTSEPGTSSTEHITTKSKLSQSLTRNSYRMDKMLRSFYKKQLTKEFILKCIEERMSSYFHYELRDCNEYPDGKTRKNLLNKGMFWDWMGLYIVDETFQDTLKVIESYGKINSIESLINVYETIKQQSITSETEVLINGYDKIIRSLKTYGHKTEDTDKNLQQVHLSFK